MKHMKRILALMLAVFMLAGMTVVASADENEPESHADTYTITINGDCGQHTYEVYQIFTGDLHINMADQTKVLSNLKWGKNAAGKKDGEAVGDEIMEGFNEEKAIRLVDFDSDPCAVSSEHDENNVYTISGLPAGYYLVKDEDGTLSGTTAAYTAYILQIVENSTVSPKSSAPKVEKKVEDKNDSEYTASTWQDSADFDIGDDIRFRITADLSSNLESYRGAYRVEFVDTMSEGLSYVDNSVVVYLDGKLLDERYVTVYAESKLTVTIPDAKAIGAKNGSRITVGYHATLNDNAKIGSEGNENTVMLKYSNNPYWTGESIPELGETPKDTVIVFTYKLQVNKVHKTKTGEDGEPVYESLTGAEFTLYKLDGESGSYVKVGEAKSGPEMTEFVWEGLDDGDYKLVETKTPTGYNTIDPIFFTITAEHEVESDHPALKSLNGDVEDGEVVFQADADMSALTTQVVNQKGATLPETGGMGTTLFYIVGGVMVLAAVVLLVSKKRMQNAE